MTYEELAEAISRMTEEQKQMDVTVYVEGFDEFFPVKRDVHFIEESDDFSDVLDVDHPYIEV